MPPLRVTATDRTAAVHATLRKHYERQKNAWAYLAEVNNATGLAGGRAFADALALSLWPSRGIELNGHEIKVSRSDWLSELKKPEKSSHIQRYCDRWWIVVDDADIIQKGELPPTWGLMIASGRGITAEVVAPKLKPKPMNPGFIASLFREVTKNIDRTHVSRQTHQEVLERCYAAEEKVEQIVEERIAARIEQELTRRQPRLEGLQKAVDAFETATGRSLSTYNAKRIADVVALAEHLQYLGIEHVLSSLREAVKLAEGVRDRHAALSTATPHPVDGPTSTGDTARE